jgi:hypothetical protein
MRPGPEPRMRGSAVGACADRKDGMKERTANATGVRPALQATATIEPAATGMDTLHPQRVTV